MKRIERTRPDLMFNDFLLCTVRANRGFSALHSNSSACSATLLPIGGCNPYLTGRRLSARRQVILTSLLALVPVVGERLERRVTSLSRTGGLVSEERDDFPIERRDVVWLTARDEVAVHNDLFVHPLASGIL